MLSEGPASQRTILTALGDPSAVNLLSDFVREKVIVAMPIGNGLTGYFLPSKPLIPEAPPRTLWDVVLVDVGPDPEGVIEAIQAIQGADRREAGELIARGLPAAIAISKPAAAAENAWKRLAVEGATPRVRPALIQTIPAPVGRIPEAASAAAILAYLSRVGEATLQSLHDEVGGKVTADRRRVGDELAKLVEAKLVSVRHDPRLGLNLYSAAEAPPESQDDVAKPEAPAARAEAPAPRAITAGKATLYYTSDMGMGIRKVEVTSITVTLEPYAQYRSAVAIDFVPNGKRKVSRFVETSHPSALVLDGWGHPNPDGMWDESTRRINGGVGSVEGRYSGFDPRWQSDFDAMIAKYVAANPGVVVLADYRRHNAHNAIPSPESTPVTQRLAELAAGATDPKAKALLEEAVAFVGEGPAVTLEEAAVYVRNLAGEEKAVATSQAMSRAADALEATPASGPSPRARAAALGPATGDIDEAWEESSPPAAETRAPSPVRVPAPRGATSPAPAWPVRIPSPTSPVRVPSPAPRAAAPEPVADRGLAAIDEGWEEPPSPAPAPPFGDLFAALQGLPASAVVAPAAAPPAAIVAAIEAGPLSPTAAADLEKVYTEGTAAEHRQKAARREANLKAMWLAYELNQHPRPPTDPELLTMGAYSGWGGLGEKKGARAAFQEFLKKMPPGMAAEERGLIHEYYTPALICSEVGRVLMPYFPALATLGKGTIESLEPSAGIGRFVRTMEGPGYEQLRWHAVEYSNVVGGDCCAPCARSSTSLRARSRNGLPRTMTSGAGVSSSSFPTRPTAPAARPCMTTPARSTRGTRSPGNTSSGAGSTCSPRTASAST